MKHILLEMIAGVGLLVFGSSIGMAQDRDRDRGGDSTWYQSRDSFFREQHWKAHLFQRVREDLDQVQSSTFPGGRDEFRIARTKQELGELQTKLADNRYDQPQLDNVIAGLQRVIDSNKLSARDRDMLADDVSRLRDYREHHADWR
ncbi:MAG TPA: hypothetical protein VMH05_00085 [Bryobacteraceae bacterium]|nr:hypothetical protein [Bryobacteraceae bacterium]